MEGSIPKQDTLSVYELEWQQICQFPWRKLLAEYYRTNRYSDELGKGLLKIFCHVKNHFASVLSEPVWIRYKNETARHPAGGRYEAAAQDVLVTLSKAIKGGKKLREHYERGATDIDLARFFSTTVIRACMDVSERRAPLFSSIYGKVKRSLRDGKLVLVNVKRRLCAPTSWVDTGMSIVELIDEDIRLRLESVPLKHRSMPKKYFQREFDADVNQIFDCVGAAVSPYDLVGTLLTIYYADIDEVSLKESQEVRGSLGGEEMTLKRLEFNKIISNYGAEEVLAIHFHWLYGLTFEETAIQIAQLGYRLSESTAFNRFNSVKDQLEQQHIYLSTEYIEIFRSIVEERLTQLGHNPSRIYHE